MSEEASIESLGQSVLSARQAMKGGRYSIAESLANDALTALYRCQVPLKSLAEFAEIAINLHCIRGSSICMQGHRFDLAEADFDSATTLTRNCLRGVTAKQYAADAQLNTAITMLFSCDNMHGASTQLAKATRYLENCGDSFAEKANNLIKIPPAEQLAHLRW